MSLKKAEKLIKKQEKLHNLMSSELKALTEYLKRKRKRLDIYKMKLHMYESIIRRKHK